ncbi:hypothetical protein HDU88_002552 [Geranomyces variabilis]|nr:hypothetical protein HDU88_002552 [Geranomyces variabilis]
MADSTSSTPGDAYQRDERYNRASAAGAFLSLTLCFFVLVLFALIYCYQRHLYQRLSFRLVLAGTICDVFYAIAYVVSTKPSSPDDNTLCVASMFIQEVFLLGSLFCTTSISMNLLLVFVIKVRSDRPYEKIYFVTSAVLAFVVPMSALIAGRFGFDGSECWYILDEADDSGWNRKTLAWEWGTYYGWVLLVCIVCSVCTVLFHISVGRVKPPRQANVSDGLGNASAKAFLKTERLIHQAGYFATTDDWLWLTANFMSGAMGALNSLVFIIFDPSFATACGVLRANLVYRHYLRYLTQRRVSKNPAKRKKTSLMMYHFVRLCLLRQSDVDRMAKKAQSDDAKRAARRDAGKSPSETRSALGTITSPSQSRSVLEVPSILFLTTQRGVNLLLTESSTTGGKQPEDAREELNRL